MYARKLISRYSHIYPSNNDILPVFTNKDKNKCLDFDLDRANFVQPVKNKHSSDSSQDLSHCELDISSIDYYDDEIMTPRELAKKKPIVQDLSAKKSKANENIDNKDFVYYSDKV